MDTTSLRGDHIHMVRRTAGGIRGEEVIAQAKMLRIAPVIRNIRLRILDMASIRHLVHFATIHSCKRCRTAVIEINSGGISGLRLSNAVGPWKAPKEIIEGVVFLHDENHVLNRCRCASYTMKTRMRSKYW